MKTTTIVPMTKLADEMLSAVAGGTRKLRKRGCWSPPRRGHGRGHGHGGKTVEVDIDIDIFAPNNSGNITVDVDVDL